jgi:hypothetical protein
VASNPFFPYLAARIEQDIDHPALASAPVGRAPPAPGKEAGKDTAVPSSPNDAATASPWTASPPDDPSDLPP